MFTKNTGKFVPGTLRWKVLCKSTTLFLDDNLVTIYFEFNSNLGNRITSTSLLVCLCTDLNPSTNEDFWHQYFCKRHSAMLCYPTFSLSVYLPSSSSFSLMLVPSMMADSTSSGVCCRSLQCSCLAKISWTETLNCFRLFGPVTFSAARTEIKQGFVSFLIHLSLAVALCLEK